MPKRLATAHCSRPRVSLRRVATHCRRYGAPRLVLNGPRGAREYLRRTRRCGGLFERFEPSIPTAQVVNLDLDVDVDLERNLEHLVEEVVRSDGEDQVARRGDRRLAARLVKSRPVKGRAQDSMETNFQVSGQVGPNRPLCARTPSRKCARLRTRWRSRCAARIRPLLPPQRRSKCTHSVVKVVARGKQVTSHQLGDVVVGLCSGPPRSHVTADAEAVITLPAELSPSNAVSLLVPYAQARRALDIVGVSAGDKMLLADLASPACFAAASLAIQEGAHSRCCRGCGIGSRDTVFVAECRVCGT